MDPNVLASLSENYDVVLVTGTNGKTVTTALTVRILEEKFGPVLTNATGSNMEQGIISAFLKDGKKVSEEAGDRPIAVLEVDEASLRHVAGELQPKLIVVTNILRDQMDRYGEIYTTYQISRG